MAGAMRQIKGRLKAIVAFRVLRFVVVGVGNTALNFAILNFAFYGLHESKLVSSFIATTCAVIFSFIMNRSFVFLDKDRPAKKLVLFIAVTVSGVLLVQNTIYAFGLHLLSHHEAGVITLVHDLIDIKLSRNFVDVNLSTVVAALFVMIWNYNGYRIFVFNGERYGNEVVEADSGKA